MKVIKISYDPVAQGKSSKLPSRLKPVQSLTFDQCKEESEKIATQFVVIHNLPKAGEAQPSAYMHEALDLLRGRTIELHNRMCELLAQQSSKRRNK